MCTLLTSQIVDAVKHMICAIVPHHCRCYDFCFVGVQFRFSSNECEIQFTIAVVRQVVACFSGPLPCKFDTIPRTAKSIHTVFY